MEWYNGIRSHDGLDMYISDSQISKVRVLTSIKIANSKPIEIRVSVEANVKIRHVPKKLFTNSSTLFAAALDDGFAGQESKTVTLPEVATDVFEVWI